MSLIPANVRAVYFDAVGTLIFPEPAAGDAYFIVGRQFGSRLERDDVRHRFKKAFAEQEAFDARREWRTSEERELERWQHIVAVVLPDVSDSAACFDALYSHFADPASWRVASAAVPVLSELARRGLILGLASNFDGRLRGVVAAMPELSLVTRLVISSEVGQRKPSAGFFRAVAESAGLAPEHIFVVGDDQENDVRGARAAGMSALLIDEKTRLDDLIGGPRS